MKVETWLPIASLVIAALGPITAWITLRYNATQARKERSWHERKTIYIHALRLILEKDEITRQIGEGKELNEVSVELVDWGTLEEARFRVFASDAVLDIWDGRKEIGESQRADAIKRIRKEMG